MKRFLMVCVMVLCVALIVIAGTSRAYAVGGTYDGMDWDLTNGVLTLGDGTTQSLQDRGRSSSSWPWYSQRSTITSIVTNGTIGLHGSVYGMFSGCTGLTSMDVSGFNTSNVVYLNNLFSGCSKLTSLDLSGFDTSNVTSMEGMFSGCRSLTSLDLSKFDTSNVMDMGYMFSNCSGLTSLNLSGWNTSNVTNMVNMFSSCSGLASIDFSGFDTSHVTTMEGMFYGCSGLTSLDVSGFDTSNVTKMNNMFSDCTGLTSLDVSNFDTSKVTQTHTMFCNCTGLTSLDLSGFDMSNVLYMDSMFSGCSGLTSLNVSGWNTSKVTTMPGMFSGCSALTSLDVSGWDTSSVTNMREMFYKCSSLTSLDVSGWDTQNVTSMIGMFQQCSSLPSLDLSRWNTSKVTNMTYMFFGCRGLVSLDVSGWDTSNVTNMYYMFYGCSSLMLLDLSGWDTSNVTTMEQMFCNCSSLTSLNLSGWDASNVTTMKQMFSGCSGLKSLDLSGFKTLNVKDVQEMFYKCSRLKSLDVSGFNTSNVPDMYMMFYDCSSLTSLDLSGWDTSNVTGMSNMFGGCKGLTLLNLSGWNTANVTSMHMMFTGCSSLTSLDVSGFDTSKVTNMSSMFSGCKNLTSLDLSGLDTSNVTSMPFMFSNCSGLTSLDLSGFNTSNATSMEGMFWYCDNLRSVMLGGNNPFKGRYSSAYADLPTPPSSQDGVRYTQKWIREDRTYGSFTPAELRNNYNSIMQGTWVWEPVPTEYTIRFNASSYPTVSGAMPNVTPSATADYTIPANQFALFGFAFDHWDDGRGHIYADEAVIPANTYAAGAVIDLSAVMIPRDTSVTMQDGKFEFSIQGGETALFDNMPANMVYQVYEQTPNGWNLIAQSDASGTVVPLETAHAAFGNEYNPNKVVVRIAGTKLMSNGPADADAFTFMLYEDDTLVDIVKNKDGGLIEFSPIEYTASGVHHYIVREAVGSNVGVIYDTHQEEITVTVESDDEGNLSCNVQTDTDGILFQNDQKPGYLKLTKAGPAGHEGSEAGFVFDIQFTYPDGRPYDLAVSTLDYVDSEDVTWDLPDVSQQEVPKYTLTVTQKYHDRSGKIVSDVATEELRKGDIFNLNWVGTPAANVSITEGEDFIVRSGAGWKGVMPAQDLNVTVNYSNNYAVISRDAIRSSWNTADLSPMYAVYFIHKNGTINPSSGNHSFNIDDGTTECVVQASRGGSFDIYQYDLYWYTNADTIYLPEDCSNMFSNLGISSSVEGAGKFDLLNYVDSSRVTNMQGMFRAYGWKTLDLSNLDTSNVTDMSYMFTTSTYRDRVALEELDLSTFVTSNVTDMSHMFEKCSWLADLNLSNWDTSNVTDMSYMFNGCHYLRTLDLSGFDTSHATNMTDMYNLALYSGDDIKLREVILGECNPFIGDGTSAVLPNPKSGRVYEDSGYVEYTGKWIHESGDYGPYTSEELRDNYTGAMAGKWIWQKAPTRATIDKTKWNANVNVYGFKLQLATTFSRSENYASAEDLPVGAVRIDDDTTACSIYFWMDGTNAYWWSDAETVYLPANAGDMFSGCSSLTSLDLSGFDTSKVTNMYGMFYGCSSLASLNVSGFNTSNVTNMSYMFYECTSLTSLDVSSFDTSNVTTMDSMFYKCNRLTSLDLSGFNTSNVTDMDNMFQYCNRLMLLNFSGWDTSNVTSMFCMFDGCRGLTSLDLSGWNTSNVTSMYQMFNNCSSLTSLNLSGFDTSNAYMDYTFDGCGNLRSVTLGEKNPFKRFVDLPTPPASKDGITYTRKWIRDDGQYGPFTSAQLTNNYTSEMAGTWIWEVAP